MIQPLQTRSIYQTTKQPRAIQQIRIIVTMFRFLFRLIAFRAATGLISRLFASRAGAAVGRRGGNTVRTRR
ncbi:hypothetical protein BH18VER1_BH18VER1_13570 [soil metagenome]